MANLSQGGFWPEANAGATSIQLRRVRVPSNNSTAIFWGDCVSRTAAGVYNIIAPAGGGVPSYSDPGDTPASGAAGVSPAAPAAVSRRLS